MGLLAYDRGRLESLRLAVGAALDDLHPIRSDDEAAADAMLAVRDAYRALSERWLPRIEDILNHDPLSQYHSAWIDGNDIRYARLNAMSKLCGWEVAADPLVDNTSATPMIPPVTIPQIGAGNLAIPSSATVTRFGIPVWDGAGVTRLQYFIDDDRVCLSGTGPDVACGHGDDRRFVSGEGISNYNLAARVRVVLNHETGTGIVIAYATHGGGGEIAALPIDMTVDGPVELPDDYPSQFRLWTEGDGIDGNVVFDYRFINSETPKLLAGTAPGINGAVRIRRGRNGTVSIDGRLAQYPSVEIIRDQQLPNGYKSTLIFVKAQESGGPLNLYEPGESFAVTG